MFIDVEFGSKVLTSVQGSLGDCEAEITKGGKPKYKKFQDVIAELGGPENIKLEFPPKCGDERDAYMTALRTEIMAGKGPDVFVALSGYGNPGMTHLFPGSAERMLSFDFRSRPWSAIFSCPWMSI